MRQTPTSLRSHSVDSVVSSSEKDVGSIVSSAATPKPQTAVPIESDFQNRLSAAMMAGIAFLPIVIAAGFLAEHSGTPSMPQEVFSAELRGPIDADRRAAAETQFVDRGSERFSVRAGF